MSPKPRLLMISHVWPVPGVSGQEKRVYYMLKALRQVYHLTFLTFADKQRKNQYQSALQQLSDEVIVLPSRYNASLLSRLVYKTIGKLYSLKAGLKASNFAIGKVELTGSRVAKAIAGNRYEAVVFEYWHAHHVIDKAHFGDASLILDMHNVLWQTYKAQSNSAKAVEKYKRYEEKVWRKFDRLIAINQDETAYVRDQLGDDKVWYVPMGIDLDKWPLVLNPANKAPRIAWYGGLASSHNQRDAMSVYEDVMPGVWQALPEAEFWIIGSKPPEHIVELSEKDSRVTVTGFVQEVADVLGRVDLVLCPWQGTYGFRSRLVEVMATGTPIITTKDAAYGMNLNSGEGILFHNNPKDWSAIVIELLNSPDELLALRKRARKAVETRYSLEATYGKLPQMLNAAKGES